MRYEHRPPGVEKHQEFFVCSRKRKEEKRRNSNNNNDSKVKVKSKERERIKENINRIKK